VRGSLRLAIICIAILPADRLAHAGTVTIHPGASIQAAINANPPGTIFNLPAGVWHKQVINPRANNQFIGDPNGGTILTGDDTTKVLYGGGISDLLGVVFKNISVEHYGINQAECFLGAIHGASKWTFDHTIFRNNNCIGLNAGDGTMIIGGQFIDNAHAGIKGDGSLIIKGAEIARNNTRRDSMVNDAAGVKLVAQGKGGQLLHNWVHDNYGTGLWCDRACSGVVIDGNTVVKNAYAGIMFEISSGAIIRNNVVNDNARMQIFISSSGDVQIFNNNVRVPLGPVHGILVQADPRANAVSTQNVVIHHNTITFKGSSVSGSGTGFRSYGGPVGTGNSSDHNAFFAATDGHWFWSDPRVLSWQAYRDLRRQDMNSSFSPGDRSTAGCERTDCTSSGAVPAAP
jgi:parallel beta-helix repeat protein